MSMFKILRREEFPNGIGWVNSNFYTNPYIKKYYFDFHKEKESITKINLYYRYEFQQIVSSLKLEEVIP